jgi:hypothetical protein
MKLRATAVILLSIATLANGDVPAEKDDFTKGNWSVQLYGAYAPEFYPDDNIKLTSATVAAGYFLFDHFSVNLELPVYFANQPTDEDAWGLGINLMLRTHILVRENWSLYVDFAGGLFEGNRRVPPEGTDFNFTLKTGIGATYRLRDHLHLMGGARYFHLSNAALESPDRNPDLNAVEGYLGIMYTFR